MDPRTKIPDPPIHFSGVTNFFGPKNEFTIHQFETSVLESPMSFCPLSNHQTVVKPRDSRLNFYEGTIPVSEFVNCVERGKLGVESRQSRASAGSTCLSVAKVPPDYGVLGLPRCCTLQDTCPKLLTGTYMRVY